MKGIQNLLKMFGISAEDMQNHVAQAKQMYDIERNAMHEKLDIIIKGLENVGAYQRGIGHLQSNGHSATEVAAGVGDTGSKQ